MDTAIPLRKQDDDEIDRLIMMRLQVARAEDSGIRVSDRAELYRQTADGTRSYKVSLDQILNHGDLSTNFPVAPGDVITVPERIL